MCQWFLIPGFRSMVVQESHVIKMTKSKVTTQLIAGFAATMSLAGAGFGFGWPSPSLPKLLAEDSDIHVTSGEASWIVSVFTIGCAFGSLISAALVDRCGRKWLLLSTMIPHLISSILIGAAQNVWWFMVARVIAGLGTGMAYTVVPIYAGEIAENRIRGAVSGMVDPVVNLSVVLTYCVGPWVSPQALAGLGGALPLIFGMMFIWMPESPYYLNMKAKPDQAETSLVWFRRTTDVSKELRMLEKTLKSGEENAGTITDLLTIPGNRKALLVIVGLTAAQQLSGISAIVAYSSLIFGAIGSTLHSSICVIIIGVVQILTGVLTVFIVDLVGRRLLLLISTSGSSLFLGGVALYFQLQSTGTDVSSISWLPVTSIIGFIVMFTIGLGCLPFVVLSEIFPCNVKAWATMVSNITGSLCAVLVTKLYQVIADAYGIHASFWGFSMFTVSSTIFIYFILPETKQKSLHEILEEFHRTTESKIAVNKLES